MLSPMWILCIQEYFWNRIKNKIIHFKLNNIMCGTCGCSDNHTHHHDHSHDHLHEHDHHHDHSHTHSHDIRERVVEIEKDILSRNNLSAQKVRGYLDAKNVFSINLMSSPGSGKTTLLEKTKLLRLSLRSYLWTTPHQIQARLTLSLTLTSAPILPLCIATSLGRSRRASTRSS